MQLPNGQPFLLEGSSALIWLLALDGEDVPRALADVVGRPLDEIADDTEAFLGDLVARGLLSAESAGPAVGRS
jgi:hypothetical protein